MCCGSFWDEHPTENTGSHGGLTQGDQGGDFQGAERQAIAAGVGEGEVVETATNFREVVRLDLGDVFGAEIGACLTLVEGRFTIRHDRPMRRPEKVELLADWPEALRELRVFW